MSVKNNSGGHLAEHCKRCGCIPEFALTTFVKRTGGRHEKEIVEVHHILKFGDSAPTVALTEKEAAFLEGYV